VDGLEWRRSKWGRYGKCYYRWAERFGVRNADALIADAPGIAEYYRHQFGVRSELIRYGAPILESAPELGVRGFGLLPRQYHLVVARFERENHVLEIVDGYHRSASRFPLVVVGSAPYSADYTRKIHAAAHGDARVRFLGGVYEQGLLDALYVHARSYVHGHSVGGTNPSLLRAMGAGTAVIAYRVPFNVEVLGGHGWFFGDASELVSCFHAAEMDDEANSLFAASARARARESFRWDETALGYEALAARLSTGESIHQTARSARRSAEEWTLSASPGTDTPPAEAGH
jgi:glycosyltransferase involved in cell wall biosynthesis